MNEKSWKKVNIFISCYMGEEQSFDFSSSNKNDFVITKYQESFEKQCILYFYVISQQQNRPNSFEHQFEQQSDSFEYESDSTKRPKVNPKYEKKSQAKKKKIKIVVSTSLSPSHDFELMFGLQIKQIGTQYSFEFSTITDLVKKYEQQKLSASKLNEIIQQLKSKSKISQRQQKVQIRCSKGKIQNYFHPLGYRTLGDEMWFVPRMMGGIEIFRKMTLKVYTKYNEKIEDQEIEVNNICFKPRISEIDFEKIKNQQNLHIENQMNLISVSGQLKNKNAECLFCLQPEENADHTLDYLVSNLCDCTTKSQNIHLSCLKSSIQSKSNQIIICTVCKTPFPQFHELIRESGGKRKRKYFKIIGQVYESTTITLDRQFIKVIGKELYIGSKKEAHYELIETQKKMHGTLEILDQGQNCQQRIILKDAKTRFGIVAKKQKMSYITRTQLKQKVCAVLFGKILFHFKVQQGAQQ